MLHNIFFHWRAKVKLDFVRRSSYFLGALIFINLLPLSLGNISFKVFLGKPCTFITCNFYFHLKLFVT